MNIPAIHPKIDAADVPMEQISGNKLLTEDQKVGEATRQFEAVLLRQILESTQKTVIKSKYSEDSTATSIYRDMITNQLADSISKSGGLGLGSTLKHEFTRQMAGAASSEKPEANAASVTANAKPLLHSSKHLKDYLNPTVPPTKTR